MRSVSPSVALTEVSDPSIPAIAEAHVALREGLSSNAWLDRVIQITSSREGRRLVMRKQGLVVPIRSFRATSNHRSLSELLTRPSGRPRLLSIISLLLVERSRSDFRRVALGPELLENPLKTIDQVVMILITIENIEAGEDELVLFLNKLVQQINVFFVIEMINRQTVDELKKLLLVLRDGRHRSLDERRLILG